MFFSLKKYLFCLLCVCCIQQNFQGNERERLLKTVFVTFTLTKTKIKRVSKNLVKYKNGTEKNAYKL